MSPRLAVRDHALTCPLCQHVWHEPSGTAERARCPCCGADEGEMFRETARQLDDARATLRSIRTALTFTTESAARFKARADVLARRLELGSAAR